MKKILLIASLAMFGAVSISQSALAQRLPSFTRTYDSHVVYGTVFDSFAVYTAGKPKATRVCEDVEIPIYSGGSKADQTGNILAGAIVGGIIGNVVTGNKNGATAGAIVGGIAGANANKRKITGYRIERQCKTVHAATNNKVKYYESKIRLEGRVYRIRTTYELSIGDDVKMYAPN
ncbi:MAG: hypothetical protein GXP05_13110 [Alphaproteobacteria bacterium]|nr:hypothetical protein [Alphaproteobacteria bacterium]